MKTQLPAFAQTSVSSVDCVSFLVAMSDDAASAVRPPATGPPAADRVASLKEERKMLKRQLAAATKELKNQAGVLVPVLTQVFFIGDSDHGSFHFCMYESRPMLLHAGTQAPPLTEAGGEIGGCRLDLAPCAPHSK